MASRDRMFAQLMSASAAGATAIAVILGQPRGR